MPEASDRASVVDQLGQQGQELLERSQVMVADMLRGYLGQFQVRGQLHGGVHVLHVACWVLGRVLCISRYS